MKKVDKESFLRGWKDATYHMGPHGPDYARGYLESAARNLVQDALAGRPADPFVAGQAAAALAGFGL